MSADWGNMFFPVHDDGKSNAYLIYSEWGPHLRIPREARLAECFPDVAEKTRAEWIEEFKRIEHEIWKVAEEGAPKRYSLDAFKGRMSGLFPFLNPEALSQAWNRACYYAWHEGYA